MNSEPAVAKTTYAASGKWLPSSCRKLVTLVAVVLVGACSRPAESLVPGQREAIQARVPNAFDFTVLFKPAEPATNETAALRLAPLIILEVADTNSATRLSDQFSAISGPMVICDTNAINLNGRPHDQFSYSWAYASTGSFGQGIRMTLNSSGEPVIWEVLKDSSGADILYVAQSLELAARAEFGPPLPGRKFSIERSLKEAPEVVVANVIDDGPTPMGPVVYLRKGSGDVSTLICRCMASQGGTLLGQTNYELHLGKPQTNWQSVFSPAQLELRLRLPRGF